MSGVSIFEIAAPLFLIMDPIGNGPMALALLKRFPPKTQQKIILRELVFALLIAVFFAFLGDKLLGFLNIDPSTLRVAGGVILFIISLRMVFPPPNEGEEALDPAASDPFIVPIAVPFIAGPSLLAAVMLYAHRDDGVWTALGGLGLAWLGTAAIMLLMPQLSRLLGKRGMRAAERLMGLILILLSVQMLEDGVRMFVESM
ncbi:MarC family protein [Oceanidesulfovibrio marinus]|uniref:UPF0056 membrane protein n=1 Tax=Oceanidesulfovibrio marinus TaxID=370038 RepID=A0A6P1ZIS3_9BACT|nr:MarC family protein [Oceanidesulfovibrio marinus]QJT08303.1 NAAT family transporter [Oceanidesulfovibrio marinus]TVM35193.1 hypothetical protein DQK91_07315 [Oceanidesulfovibrio marinus]